MTRIDEAIRLRRLSSVNAMTTDPIVRIRRTDRVLGVGVRTEATAAGGKRRPEGTRDRRREDEQWSDLERISMLSCDLICNF